MEIYICADFSQDGIEMLKAAGHTVRTGGWGYTSKILNEDELIAEIGDAEILFLGYEPVTRKVLENTHLKAIFSIRGGARANVDVDAATELGIPVFCTFGREALPVADFTICLPTMTAPSPTPSRCLRGRKTPRRSTGASRKSASPRIR